MITKKGLRALLIAWVVGIGGMLVAHAAATSADPDADYDRLDGKGESGKRVDVIEWEGNLEIHVYPAGSLKGLALKLDKRNKDKPVLVIGYRFDGNPGKQLIRRAILSIDLREGFKAFRDPAAGSDGYDKIIVSNNGLSGQVAAFKLDPEPTQLYPDGHPALAGGGTDSPAPGAASVRKPAAQPKPAPESDGAPQVDEGGTIQPFFMRKSTGSPRSP